MATAEHLNVREAARRLGVHENTVRNWADRGILRPIRLPGSGYRRFRADDIERIAREMREAVAPVEEREVVRPKQGRAVGREGWE